MFSNCKVIAEMCCNHMGNFDMAFDMIYSAKLSGAHYAKFQKRNPKECVPKIWHKKSHPCPENSFGNTYLEHREKLEFTIEQHREIKHYCENVGIGYSSSVWDITSAREMISLNPDYIKIPSACCTYFDLLSVLYEEFSGDVHISLGMTSPKERQKIFDYIAPFKDRTILYWTTSEYPVPFEHLYLLEMKKIRDKSFRIGYSGHNLGIAVDMLAYSLGATYIERHFTLDRTLKGTDQSASLEPGGLKKLCRDLEAAKKSLTYKNIDLTEKEKENRAKLRR